MITIFNSGVSGMIGQQQKVDNISHNISNVNTSGYKGNRSNFSDLVYQDKSQRGTAVTPEPETDLLPQAGRGSLLTSSPMDLTPGTPIDTGRPLDLAIEGEGYFGVQLPDESINYTRCGSFNLDEQGRLVTSEGYLVEGDLESVPSDRAYETLHVNSQGEVYIREVSDPEDNAEGEGPVAEDADIRLGQLDLYSFENPSGLSAQGGNLLAPTEASGDAEQGVPGEGELGSIRQGVLESSNVDLTSEMSKLILTQKNFQFNSRSIHRADEMWAMANHIKR